MMQIRKSEERGFANHGWLQARHTFSFASYYDPQHMHFRHLRVINQDIVQPGTGFGTHPHRDMEIITYVLRGEIRHQDSMGHVETLKAGDVQVMTAGRGVTHSEMNASRVEELELLQIWILPDEKGYEPGYHQAHFSRDDKLNRLKLIVSGPHEPAPLKIHQGVRLYACCLEVGKTLSHDLDLNRYAWVQVVQGSLTVNGQALNPGDGAGLSQISELELSAIKEAEFLLFDLP